MKKTFKLAMFAAICLVGVVVAGVFWVDSIAEAGVEQGGSYAMGVPTDVRGMDIGVLSGGVAVDGMQIDNPAGFDTPYFLEMGEGRVGVSLGTLMEDKVVLPELTISGIKLNLENRITKSNYGAILDNLNAFTAKLQTDAAPQDGKKFVIRKVIIDDVLVQMQMFSIAGQPVRLPVSIARIELSDVGASQPNGVQLAEIFAQLMEAILHAVLDQAGDLMPGDMASSLKGGLSALPGLGQKAVSRVGEAKKLAEDEVKRWGVEGQQMVNEASDAAAKEVDKASKELEKGLADFLKPKKDK